MFFRNAVGAFSALTVIACVSGDHFHVAAITAAASLAFLPAALKEARQ